jgi:hypothetical protein
MPIDDFERLGSRHNTLVGAHALLNMLTRYLAETDEKALDENDKAWAGNETSCFH